MVSSPMPMPTSMREITRNRPLGETLSPTAPIMKRDATMTSTFLRPIRSERRTAKITPIMQPTVIQEVTHPIESGFRLNLVEMKPIDPEMLPLSKPKRKPPMDVIAAISMTVPVDCLERFTGA